MGSAANRSLQESVSGFPGVSGARTSINLMGAQCLVDGKARLISNSDSSSSLVRASLYEITPHAPVVCFVCQAPASHSQ